MHYDPVTLTHILYSSDIILDFTWSWVYFPTAAGVPDTVVGSRWLECLTPKLNASLFSGSMLQRLYIFIPALIHIDQFFWGLPLPLVLGNVTLVMEFVHEEEGVMFPNHFRGLVLRAAVTSCIPKIAQCVCSHFVIIWYSACPSVSYSLEYPLSM